MKQDEEYVTIWGSYAHIFISLVLGSFTTTILFDTGTGNKKRLINVTELADGLTQEYCTALLALHAFTHCDTTSAFRGIGKKKPIKVMQKFPSTNPSCQSSDLSGWSLRSCLLAGRNSHVPYMVDQGSRTLTDSGTPSSRRSVMKAIGYGLA